MILSCTSLNQPKPKFCINCKYFIPDIGSDIEYIKYGKCSLFPIIPIIDNNNHNPFLVTGKNEEKVLDYSYCMTSRKFDNMCGENGKRYKKKYKKKDFN